MTTYSRQRSHDPGTIENAERRDGTRARRLRPALLGAGALLTVGMWILVLGIALVVAGASDQPSGQTEFTAGPIVLLLGIILAVVGSPMVMVGGLLVRRIGRAKPEGREPLSNQGRVFRMLRAECLRILPLAMVLAGIRLITGWPATGYYDSDGDHGFVGCGLIALGISVATLTVLRPRRSGGVVDEGMRGLTALRRVLPVVAEAILLALAGMAATVVIMWLYIWDYMATETLPSSNVAELVSPTFLVAVLAVFVGFYALQITRWLCRGWEVIRG